MLEKPKRILIDGRFVGVGESVSRQTLETTKAVLGIDQQNRYTLLVRPVGLPVAEKFFRLKPKNLDFVVLDISHYSFSEQSWLLFFLIKEQFDLIHFMQFNHPILYRGAFVVNILDLTLFKSISDYGFLKRLAFSIVMKSAVKNSRKIITVSQASKKEIIDRYRIDRNKIAVSYLGVDPIYNTEISKETEKITLFQKKYQIRKNYLLYTGMWKKHKNLLRLFEGYLTFRQENSHLKNQLVLIGKIDKSQPEIIAKAQEINDKLAEKAVVMTGFVAETELPLAYAGALCYITPSLSEGFGLPPLESIACGTPVAAANISATPEVLAGAALYFNPYNPDDIKKAVLNMATDNKIRQDLKKIGLQRIRCFSWRKTGEATEAVYRSVLK